MKSYHENSGYYFVDGTCKEVESILISCKNNNKRIRIFYGKNGNDWHEEFDVFGRVSCTCGKIKSMILLNNKKSLCGSSILTDCIIRIIDIETKKDIYVSKDYKPSIFTNKESDIFVNGIFFGTNKNEVSAKRFCDFMNGKRMSK